VTNDPSAAQSAQVLAEQMWLRDELGWRREWLVGRLAALTNYSVYAIQDGTRLSGPIYFTTKSGMCRLLPFFFSLFHLCADVTVVLVSNWVNGSVVFLPARTWITLLP
jgi:hypothetical protein